MDIVIKNTEILITENVEKVFDKCYLELKKKRMNQSGKEDMIE